MSSAIWSITERQHISGPLARIVRLRKRGRGQNRSKRRSSENKVHRFSPCCSDSVITVDGRRTRLGKLGTPLNLGVHSIIHLCERPGRRAKRLSISFPAFFLRMCQTQRSLQKFVGS